MCHYFVPHILQDLRAEIIQAIYRFMYRSQKKHDHKLLKIHPIRLTCIWTNKTVCKMYLCPGMTTPGEVTPYVSPPTSPPTLTPQRPLSPCTPEPPCPDTPKYKTTMLYRYKLQIFLQFFREKSLKTVTRYDRYRRNLMP